MSPTELAPERIRKGERTRTRILDAAADVLARKGYAAATLTAVSYTHLTLPTNREV